MTKNTPPALQSGFLKRFTPVGLLGRSLLIIVLPILILQIISTIVFFDRHWTKVTNRLVTALSGEIGLLAEMIEKNPGDAGALDWVEAHAATHLDILLSYAPAEKLEETGVNAKGFLPMLMSDNLQYEMAQALGGKPYFIVLRGNEDWIPISVQLKNGVMHAAVSDRRLFSTAAHIFLLWTLGISITVVGIAAIFMRNQIRPIRRLAIAADRFGKGRDVSGFRIEGAREIRQAGQAFNTMRTRLQRQMEQRATMLAGISHDLRTPLTRIRLAVSMLPPSEVVEGIKKDVQDMETMTEAYLDFMRGEGDEKSVEITVSQLVIDSLQALTPHERTISTRIPPQLKIQGRPAALGRVMRNIIQNALMYAGNVTITAAADNEYTTITIDDNGPGIPDNKKEDVFKPFFRLDPARNLNKSGIGLGMTVARDIIASHGGTISLQNSPQGGLRVVITLPV